MKKNFLLGSIVLGLGMCVVGCGDSSVTTEPTVPTEAEEAAMDAQMEESMAAGAAMAAGGGDAAPGAGAADAGAAAGTPEEGN